MRPAETMRERYARVHLDGDRNPPVHLGRRAPLGRAPSDPAPVRRFLQRIFG